MIFSYDAARAPKQTLGGNALNCGAARLGLVVFLAIAALRAPPHAVCAETIPVARVVRNNAVDFQNEIVPILRKKCLACHSTSERQGELVLETPEKILKGGDAGPAIVAGKGAESLLLKLASHQEEPFMPPPDNDVAAPPLTPQELGLIKLWIDQGAQAGSQNTILSPTQWRPLPRGVNPIYAVAVTPDGQYAACSRANQIFIYHVPTGRVVTRLTDPTLQARDGDPQHGVAHLDLVQSLAFNREGDMLASGGFRTVKLWRRPRDVFRLKLNAAKETVASVAVSPDQKTLAVGAGNEVKLWDLASGKFIVVFTGHTAAVTDLRFSADGNRLFSSSLDHTVRVWSLKSLALVGRLDAPAAINALELVASAEAGAEPMLAVGGEDTVIRIYNAPAPTKRLPEIPAHPTAMATTSNHQIIAVANAAGVVRILDREGAVLKEWKTPGAPVVRLAFHPLATPPQGDKTQPVAIVATAGADGAVRLWNYQTAELLEAIQGPRVALKSLAFRPDGKQLISGSVNGAITAWNIEGAASEVLYPAVEQPLSLAILSLDGKRVAAAGVRSGQPAIFVFDLQTKKISHTLLGHKGRIRSLAFSPDGAKLVSGSADKSARIWDLNNSKAPELTRFEGHGGEVTAVAFNSNATQVLTGSADKTLVLWNAADAAEIKAFSGHAGAIVSVAFGAGNQPVSASADKTIRIWNPNNGQPSRTITDPQVVSSMALTRDGARAAVAGVDKAVRIYQLNSGRKLVSLEGRSSPVTGLAFSADGARIVATTAAQATLWDAASGQLQEIVPVAALAAAMFAVDAKSLLTVNAKQIERRPLRFALAMTGLTKPITSLTFHPNGQVFYASSLDGTLRCFQAVGGRQVFSARHGVPIHDAAISPDGRFLVSAGDDKTIRVWNASNGGALPSSPLQAFKTPVLSVAFSSDGARLLGGSASPANEVLAFDFATRTLEQGFVGHTGSVHTMLGLEAENFVTMSDDGNVRIWPLTAVTNLTAHRQPITSLAVLPTNHAGFFSASQDGIVRQWNVQTGRQIRQFNHGGPIESIAVRSDGKHLASASSNHSVKLWNILNGRLVAEMRGDLRAKNVVTRMTQQQTSATAKRDAAKRDSEAAEKDVPVKTAAAKKAGDALAAANKAVTEKTAARQKAEAAKAAAEKIAIAAAAAAQRAEIAKAGADRLAIETAKLAALVKMKAKRFASLLQQAPNDQTLKAANIAVNQKVAAATAKALAAKTAQAAPLKAVAAATKSATAAAANVTATQKPYNDAITALRPVLATQKTASQLHVIAVRELKEAKALTPRMKAKQSAAAAALVIAQQALEKAKQAAAAAEQPLHAVAFSPDGRQLVTGGDFPAVHSWDAETGAALASYVGHQGAVRCLVFASDDELLSGSADKSALAWKLNPSWELAQTIGNVGDPSQLINRVLALDFNREGSQIATGGGEPSRSGEIKIWKVADGALLREIENSHDDTVHGVRFSPDGKTVASCGSDKFVKTFDVATGKLLRRFEGHTHHVLGVSWKGDGQVLASAGADHVVKIWNARTGDLIRTVSGFKKQVTSLRFIGDTADFAATSGNKIVRFIRSTNGGVVRNFAGAADFMHSIDVTPDGAILVAGGHDSRLIIWNGVNGRVLQTLKPPNREETASTVKQ